MSNNTRGTRGRPQSMHPRTLPLSPKQGGGNSPRRGANSPNSPVRQTAFVPTPGSRREIPPRRGNDKSIPPPKPPKVSGAQTEEKQFRQSIAALPHEKMKSMPPLPTPPGVAPVNRGPPAIPTKPNSGAAKPPVPPKPFVNLPVLPRSRMLSVPPIPESPDRQENQECLSPVKRASVALQGLDFNLGGSPRSSSPDPHGEKQSNENVASDLRPDLRRSMKRVGSMKIFAKKRIEIDQEEYDRSMSGELVVKGGWEKPGEANSLTKKLQREAERMEKEKVEISVQSKSYETENARLLKWRKMLEDVQQEDIIEIHSLEEEVSKASREKEEYAKRVAILEEQCSQLMGTLDRALKDLKTGMKK